MLLVLRLKGSLLQQANAKRISVNGSISRAIASWGLKRKGNLRIISGHQLRSLCPPSLRGSRAQKLCRTKCSAQNTTEPTNRPAPTELWCFGFFFFFPFLEGLLMVLFQQEVAAGRAGQGIGQGLALSQRRSWPRRCGAAAALCPSAPSASALLS